MKPALQVRLHQQLSLTPQLQQAIRLLQLSNLELGTELRQLADANPMLMLDGLDDSDPGMGDNADEDREGDSTDRITEDEAPEDYGDRDDAPLAFETPRGPPPSSDGGNGLGEESAAAESLREHLLWQFDAGNGNTSEQVVFAMLVDALDDDGYLREDNAAISEDLPAEFHADVATVERVRQQLLHCDPVGIGSRDLRECLAVQLELLHTGQPGAELAARIIDDGLELLARGDLDRLRRKFHVDGHELAEAVALVRALEPRPGAGFDTTPTEYIAPDAYASRHNGRWQVSLSPSCQPRVEINQHYCGLLAKARGEDAGYLRGQLQEARWLLKSIESRAETILKVANAIVRAQGAFLDYGAEAMRPLVLREVAEEVGMHESTISRVTTRKYLHTPRGIFEFKYFFSSGVATEGGGSASATAVQAIIRKLVDEENPRKPLSDQALTRQLEQRGIHVARRTVAKYRESLRIPSSSQRVHLDQGSPLAKTNGNSLHQTESIP